MNREDAFRHISDYWSRATSAQKLPRFAGRRGPALEELNKRLITVNRILRELAPDLPLIRARTIAQHGATWPYIQRAMRIINIGRELDRYKHPGIGVTFPLKFLDPVISEVAIPLWEANKFRQAVADAATSLNRFAQERLDRHNISDSALMNEAFSNEPPKEGKPRLRCAGDHRLVTIKDQQNGARQIANGAFLAIRNPAHHLTGDWNPATAFHYLTILSQVAYYFRHWVVEKYEPPTPDFNPMMAMYQAQMKAAQAQPQAVPKASTNGGSPRSSLSSASQSNPPT
jgi:hypothetical protein